MKYLLFLAGLIVFFFSYSPTVLADNAAQNVCEYVAVDDKRRLRSFLKVKRLKIRKIFDDISCNGKNLVAFADSKGAIETAEFLISKLPKKKVKAILSSISSEDILLVAKKRIE